jgi:hypothetical protein
MASVMLDLWVSSIGWGIDIPDGSRSALHPGCLSGVDENRGERRQVLTTWCGSSRSRCQEARVFTGLRSGAGTSSGRAC